MTASVISNCFRKGLYPKSLNQASANLPDPTTTIREDISSRIRRLPIRDAIDVNQFLNPAEEEVLDAYDTIDDLVLSQSPGPNPSR